MKRAMVAIVAGLYAFCGVPYATSVHAAVDWVAQAKELAKSVVAIERNGTGVGCTGFVINARATNKDREDVDLIATAAHCDAEKLWADQSAATVKSKHTEKDVLVLEVDDTGRPALKLAAEDPAVGQEAASFGHGYGLGEPMLRRALISAKTYIPYQGIGGPLFLTDLTFVEGMSGGPVVNVAGEVVMMVQKGTDAVGVGVGAETLRAKIGKYWEKPVAKP
jgi:S1-C subfamily serine protease